MVKLELQNICLVTKQGGMQHKLMCFVWLKDDLCDHFKHDMMTTWGRIDSSEKPKQQYIYVFLEKVTFFSKLLSFTVAKSLETNGSHLQPGVLDLSFILGYANSTSFKFRVSACSQKNTVVFRGPVRVKFQQVTWG